MIGRKTLFYSAALVGLALLGAGWTAARADSTYPRRPVRWVVPYTAGGATDVLSRLICQRLSERLGQPFVVENKPGAGSNLGTQTVINSAADGYTLLLTSTANAINASFDPSLPYDFAKGIVPVAGIARIPLVLVVNNDLPSPTPRPIPASSASPHPGSAPRFIFPGSCSRRWPAFSSRTCPIADRRRA